MELRQLKYFVAVAEELHFRRAAERLYVAQPAVSEQIRKLEAELGVRLFDRTNRRVAITEAGAALLEEGRRVLAQADAAQLAARNARERAGARLRIGYLPDSLPASVPRALQSLAAAAARVDDLDGDRARGAADPARSATGSSTLVVAGLPAATGGLHVTSLGHQSMVGGDRRDRHAGGGAGAEPGAARSCPPRRDAALDQPRLPRRGALALPRRRRGPGAVRGAGAARRVRPARRGRRRRARDPARRRHRPVRGPGRAATSRSRTAPSRSSPRCSRTPTPRTPRRTRSSAP